MVKVFSVIVVADGFAEEFVHLFGQSLCITGPNSIEQRFSIPGLSTLVKPLLDGRLENFPNLCIGDHESRASLRQRLRKVFLSRLRQVASQI